jgi:chaperonin cofactor prefoldin
MLALISLMDGAAGGEPHWMESAAHTLAEATATTAGRLKTLHERLKYTAQEFLDAFTLLDPRFGAAVGEVRTVVSDGTMMSTVQWLSVAFKLFKAVCTKGTSGQSLASAAATSAAGDRVQALTAELTASNEVKDRLALELTKLRAGYKIVVEKLRYLEGGRGELSFADRRAGGLVYRNAVSEASVAQFALARVKALCASALSRIGMDATAAFSPSAHQFAFGAGAEAHVNFLFHQVQDVLNTLVQVANGHAAARDRLERQLVDANTVKSQLEEMQAGVVSMYQVAGYPLVKKPGQVPELDFKEARTRFEAIKTQAKMCEHAQARLCEVLAELRTSEQRRNDLETALQLLHETPVSAT